LKTGLSIKSKIREKHGRIGGKIFTYKPTLYGLVKKPDASRHKPIIELECVNFFCLEIGCQNYHTTPQAPKKKPWEKKETDWKASNKQ